VGVSVGNAVSVGVNVGVWVGTSVFAAIRVGVDVAVRVLVGAEVAVSVGAPAKSMINRGGLVPASFALYQASFCEVVFIPKLYVPLPWIALVTSNSTKVLSATDPNVLKGVLAMVGALSQVNPFSTHGVLLLRYVFDT
jgi:hypothetical protein